MQISQILQLMQLSDTAAPIGAQAHSFGLETLVEWNEIEPESLGLFLHNYLRQQAPVDACYCRRAYTLCRSGEPPAPLCRRLSALKLARESRNASILLGRRLLHLCVSLMAPEMAEKLAPAFTDSETHHVLVFGYAAALLGLDEDLTVAAYLQQSVAATISAAQRLMPVGQRQAAGLLWSVKDEIQTITRVSREQDVLTVGSFMPMLDIASMRHPRLETRLFLS